MSDHVWGAVIERTGHHYLAEGFNCMLGYTIRYFVNIVNLEELVAWKDVGSLLGSTGYEGGKQSEAFALLMRLITRKPKWFSSRRLQTDYEDGSDGTDVGISDIVSAVTVLKGKDYVEVINGSEVCTHLSQNPSRVEEFTGVSVATAAMVRDICIALLEESTNRTGKKRWRTKEQALDTKGKFTTKLQCVQYLKASFTDGSVDQLGFARLWDLIVGDVLRVKEELETHLRTMFELFDIACRFDPRRALDTAVGSGIDSTTVHSGGHTYGPGSNTVVARRGVSLCIALAHAGILPTPGIGNLPICVPSGPEEACRILRRGRPFHDVEPPQLLLYSSREGLTSFKDAMTSLRQLVDVVDLSGTIPHTEEMGRTKAVLLLHQSVEVGLTRAIELQRLFQLWRAVRVHMGLPLTGTLEDTILEYGPLSPAYEGLLSLLPVNGWLRCAEYLLEVLAKGGDDDDATAANKAMSTVWLRRLLVEVPVIEVVRICPEVVTTVAAALVDSGEELSCSIPTFLLECLRGRHVVGGLVRTLCRSRPTDSMTDLESDPSVFCQLAKDPQPPTPKVHSVLSVPYRYHKRGHWWYRLAVCAYSGIRVADSESARQRKSRAQDRALAMLESLFFAMVQWRQREESACTHTTDPLRTEGAAPYTTATELTHLLEEGLSDISLTEEEEARLTALRGVMPAADCRHNLLWSMRYRWYMRRADLINCERVFIKLHAPPRRWKDPPATLISFNLKAAVEVFVRARRGADGGWLRGADASYVVDDTQNQKTRESLKDGESVEEVSAQWYRAGCGKKPQPIGTTHNYRGVPWDAHHVEGWWYEQLVRSLLGPIFNAPNGAFIRSSYSEGPSGGYHLDISTHLWEDIDGAAVSQQLMFEWLTPFQISASSSHNHQSRSNLSSAHRAHIQVIVSYIEYLSVGPSTDAEWAWKRNAFATYVCKGASSLKGWWRATCYCDRCAEHKVGVDTTPFKVFRELVLCMPLRAIAMFLRRMFLSPLINGYSMKFNGFPDLGCWCRQPYKGVCKDVEATLIPPKFLLSEVKSPNDHLSEKQLTVMDALIRSGFVVHLLHVVDADKEDAEGQRHVAGRRSDTRGKFAPPRLTKPSVGSAGSPLNPLHL